MTGLVQMIASHKPSYHKPLPSHADYVQAAIEEESIAPYGEGDCVFTDITLR